MSVSEASLSLPSVSRRRSLGMMAAICAAGVAPLMSAPADGHTIVRPRRGSALRRDLLNAVRPAVERAFGAPVELVVMDMRVAGALAFVQVTAQRPGGVPIDIARSPLAQQTDPSLIDGTRTEAFLRLVNGRWQLDEHAVGATDLWYADPALCDPWRALLPRGVCS
jgi:hypothetical protein